MLGVNWEGQIKMNNLINYILNAFLIFSPQKVFFGVVLIVFCLYCKGRYNKIKKQIAYETKIFSIPKRPFKVGEDGCESFNTKTVIIIANIASKNVSNLFVCMVYYFNFKVPKQPAGCFG